MGVFRPTGRVGVLDTETGSLEYEWTARVGGVNSVILSMRALELVAHERRRASRGRSIRPAEPRISSPLALSGDFTRSIGRAGAAARPSGRLPRRVSSCGRPVRAD